MTIYDDLYSLAILWWSTIYIVNLLCLSDLSLGICTGSQAVLYIWTLILIKSLQNRIAVNWEFLRFAA